MYGYFYWDYEVGTCAIDYYNSSDVELGVVTVSVSCSGDNSNQYWSAAAHTQGASSHNVNLTLTIGSTTSWQSFAAANAGSYTTWDHAYFRFSVLYTLQMANNLSDYGTASGGFLQGGFMVTHP